MRRVIAAVLASVLLTGSNLSPVLAHDGIVNRTNHFRATYDLRPLRTNDNLDHLAHRRARQIVTAFHHDFWWWGRTNCAYVGENIAFRKPAPPNPARWLMEAWKDSPLHRANLLGNWRRMGAGYVITSDGALYGVQLFCRPR